ncbi:HWE histidine kinase domain-containing protein [Mesorhizobium sp. WSM4976]|uniref:sensor histidine kinase n=1 Tax=Mesorhizobium sp. WSM4976 TaxID=3038549 RepID=UPI002417D559|nr:HWE histidine kinase domain-containing protein [Mesorhizobium sp. WSM4976]MDG4897258.1 HWE histidine kinase domain-containing protein [Mesorhizobium sp. WSM4976]
MATGPNTASWPSGNGEVAGLIRDCSWDSSPLGPPQTWTPSLRTTVDLMLAAEAQIVLFCGPDFVALYNDAYAPTIGDKHPRALGRPARENWAELWDDLEPLLSGVLTTGETFSARDRPFYIERSGGVGETVYFDVSYSAVRAQDGSVEAVLCIVSETTARVLAAARLRESEQRFRALVKASSDVIYRMSPDWQEMHELDGRGFLPAVEGPMIRWRDAHLFPEDIPSVQAAIDRAIEERSVFELEHRVRRADGGVGWTLSRAIPILDDDGAILEWFGMAADVTARRASDQHIQLLMREVNHRVKNQYAVILSMIRETAKRANDPRLFEHQIRERIMALSRSHDLLVVNDWRGAGMSDLVREHLKPFAHEERVELSGPDLTLRLNAVQNIGMALHELGTNATKYGALSADRGTVRVSWRVPTDAEEPREFELVWEERTSRAAEPPEDEPHLGFGSVVLQRVVPTSLSGSASLERQPGFVRWTLSAPLDNVVVDEAGRLDDPVEDSTPA